MVENENKKHNCTGDCNNCEENCVGHNNCSGDCNNCGANCASNASCNGDCNNCSEHCSGHNQNFLAKLNEYSHIKKIIGVVSGKGGVGKSFVSSLLAVSLAQRGLNVGIMDADITGPSIGKTFGIKEKAYGQNNLIVPYVSEGYGIKIISANMMLENDDDPIIWRGSLISNLVKQFYSDVLWGELDVLVIDMPPGTGDVALTTFQSIPLDGIVMVTTPQDLVSMIVAKTCKMADMMNIKMLGVVENMAFVECPNCGERIYMYGESNTLDMIKPFNLNLLASLPINPHLTKLVNDGLIEHYEGRYLDKVVEIILKDIDLTDAY